MVSLAVAAPATAAEPAEGAAGKGALTYETETRHTLHAGGKPIQYVARTGLLTVPPDAEDDRKGRMFFVAYELAEASDDPRPLTFVFNGGPGAASAYLHVGAMGPRRLAFADNGQVAETPRLVDNAESWIRFTDLVFVDPIGTGFSRAETPERKEGNKDKARQDSAAFWETEKDLDTLGAFIRLYLSRHQRWLAPVVLAGESYGGFRVGALAERLQSDFEIAVRGLVMISPAIELGLLAHDRFRLMPWISRVPSLAAAARVHGKAATDGAMRNGDVQAEVERFAVGELLPGLAMGRMLPDAERAALMNRLAGYIGLPPDLVERYGGKVPAHVFASRLLRAEGRVVSSYDASIAYPAPHPARDWYRDLRLARISAAVAMAFNHDLRTRLGVTADQPYRILNAQVSRRWVWQDERRREGPPGAAESLESAFRSVPGLRGLLVHGLYDLVTPYFASRYVVNQFGRSPELQERLTLRTYEGGHMFYSHAAARVAFYRDAQRLYGEISAGNID